MAGEAFPGGAVVTESEKTNEILAVVQAATARGESLTTREIGEKVGLSSSASVHAHLELLVRAGCVRYLRGYVEAK